MRKIFFLILTFLFSFFPLLAFSQELELEYPPLPGISAPQRGISLEEFLQYIYRFSLIIGGAISVSVFTYGGVLYLISIGNPLKMREGRERLLSAVLGMFILFGSYLILTTLDPSLAIFQTSEISSVPLPEEEESIEVELRMPKSCQEITDFKEDSFELADFLGIQVRALFLFIDGPFGPRGFLDFLEKIKDIDCPTWGQTHCRPAIDSTECLVIDCQWKNNPEREILKKMKKAEAGLEEIKEVLRKLVESEEAKKVKGILTRLKNCNLNPATSLYIQSQAEEHEILDLFGFTGEPLNFYCCEKVDFPTPTPQSPCEVIPVGRMPERLLEIQNELIFIASYIIEKYQKIVNHAGNMAFLVSSCNIKNCEPGNCKGSNFDLGLTCPPGDDCSAGAEPICPDEIFEDLEEEYERAKKIVEQEFIISGMGLGNKLANLQVELQDLKVLLTHSEVRLTSRDPTTEHLLSCLEAKGLGLRENLTLLGIGSGERKIRCQHIKDPLTDSVLERRHGLDYYICPKQ